jgi:hypothetical protein
MPEPRSDTHNVQTVQRHNALGKEHTLILIALPMTEAPVATPKRVDCSTLRHGHRESIADGQ